MNGPTESSAWRKTTIILTTISIVFSLIELFVAPEPGILLIAQLIVLVLLSTGLYGVLQHRDDLSNTLWLVALLGTVLNIQDFGLILALFGGVIDAVLVAGPNSMRLKSKKRLAQNQLQFTQTMDMPMSVVSVLSSAPSVSQPGSKIPHLPSIDERLKTLTTLRDHGFITEEEFLDQRKTVLADL